MAFPPFPVIIVIVTPVVIAKRVIFIEYMSQTIYFSKILITLITIDIIKIKMFQEIYIGKIISTIITIDIIKIEIFQGIYISKIIPGGAAAATGISTKNVILAALIMMMGMKIIMMIKTIVVLKAIIVLTLLRSGKLRMGDRVLAVNTTDIRIVTHQEAVMALLQHCQVNWTTETVIKVIIINQ